MPAIGAVGYGLRRASRELDERRVPLLGVTAAFVHLNGLLRGEGSLTVAGIAVDGGDERALRARVGLVFQDPDECRPCARTWPSGRSTSAWPTSPSAWTPPWRRCG